jgi:hypothetical protein
MRFAPFLPAVLLVFGCGPDSTIYRMAGNDTFTQEPPANVDILWVIDNSPSMREEQEETARRFEDFISNLEETNIDFHLGVITTDLLPENPNAALLLGDPPVITQNTPNYVTEFQDRVQVGIDGSDMEMGLEAAYEALTEPLVSGPNAGFLRADSVLSIIVLSDENDCSDRGALPAGADQYDCYELANLLVPPADYVEGFRELKDESDNVFLSAIVGPDVVENCPDSTPGTRYLKVADNTGGIRGNICDQDFTGIMDELGLSVSGVRTSFLLTNTPVLDTIEVRVNDVQVIEDEENGWTFDETTLYLTFHGKSIPARGTTIHVTYDIA